MQRRIGGGGVAHHPIEVPVSVGGVLSLDGAAAALVAFDAGLARCPARRQGEEVARGDDVLQRVRLVAGVQAEAEPAGARGVGGRPVRVDRGAVVVQPVHAHPHLHGEVAAVVHAETADAHRLVEVETAAAPCRSPPISVP